MLIFIGRNDTKAETPVLRPPDVKNWLTGKDPDAGKDWRQEEKGRTKDKMVGWHHQLNGHEFEENSRSWWWTERPGVLQFMGLRRVRHDWVTELTDWVCVSDSSSKAGPCFVDYLAINTQHWGRVWQNIGMPNTFWLKWCLETSYSVYTLSK